MKPEFDGFRTETPNPYFSDLENSDACSTYRCPRERHPDSDVRRCAWCEMLTATDYPEGEPMTQDQLAVAAYWRDRMTLEDKQQFFADFLFGSHRC